MSVSPEALDAEFGFDAARLDAVEIAPVILRPVDLAPRAGRDAEAEARLIDRLTARLGAARIGRPTLSMVHAPERANGWAVPEDKAASAPAPPSDGVMRRPLRLFARAQPVEAVASMPDGPPMRFRWRRVLHDVARAEGPERIMPDWLRAPHGRARDYYRVEDAAGPPLLALPRGPCGRAALVCAWAVRMSEFAELCAASNFSFLRAAAHPEELVETAKALGLAGIGIADRNSLAGIVRAHAIAKELEFPLAVGARLVFRDGTPDILAYPKDRPAYARLTRLLTIGNRRAPKGECWLGLR